MDGSGVISAGKEAVDKVLVSEDKSESAQIEMSIEPREPVIEAAEAPGASVAPVENDLADKDLDTSNVYQTERVRIVIDPSRDANLTAFGKETLEDRYLLPEEAKSPQKLFARVAAHYGDDSAHAQRIYDYISDLWFMPATPVLSNGGTKRGLPISCFLNDPIRSRASSICGTRMSGSPRAAAASAAIGAICARSASRSAAMARRRAWCRSSG
jgi:ribonucleoside-diphosphate reductase alpha chain